MKKDLFSENSSAGSTSPNTLEDNGGYAAKDIEVLEGLEPVRMRPGMYVGGTDQAAMHHLFKEVLDNAMDEVIAGHASAIEVVLLDGNWITVRDNGRGIPVDMHPKYPNKSALEVILTTLHSGGKFSGKVYETSGGLHGVGISVVNALSEALKVKVWRGDHEYTQEYSRGLPTTRLLDQLSTSSQTGTEMSFRPDTEIFGDIEFDVLQLYKLCCGRAYLFPGIKIKWTCQQQNLPEGVPNQSVIHYPGGLEDYIKDVTGNLQMVVPEIFASSIAFQDTTGKVECAIAWLVDEDHASAKYYCNTVATPLGGTHEAGFKTALLKAIKNYGELTGDARTVALTAEDVFNSAMCILSVFIRNPVFQGQTKDKLLSTEASKLVENAVRVHFENWLAASPKVASQIIEKIIEDYQERINRKKSKAVSRKTPVKSLRLPGKLADCSLDAKAGSELFLVEGDSAGGSAKQARNRETQAILPLKGKILNVANSSVEKITANAEIRDLVTALGCECGNKYRDEDLRYEKVVIMTDADVDGAHISTLLMTFFYKQMPQLIRNGHLFLAQPPLYKVVHKNSTVYVTTDEELQKIVKKCGQDKLAISRFKGLGEMTAAQLKETTMDPQKRSLLKVEIVDPDALEAKVGELMGKDPEARFRFIQTYGESTGQKLDEMLDS
jgi:topoisomerase-4 subunit B